jgi:hypothetical protein
MTLSTPFYCYIKYHYVKLARCHDTQPNDIWHNDNELKTLNDYHDTFLNLLGVVILNVITLKKLERCHDTQHNDIQHNAIKHSDSLWTPLVLFC